MEQPPSALASLLEANTEKLLTCVHCGLCLPSCPTYRVLGNENDSPRGRVYLMRSVAEGKLDIGDAFITHIDLCLGCRACETACPSSVPYGHLLEAARAEVSRAKTARRFTSERVVAFVLNQVFTRPQVLRFVFAAARCLRDRGLARLAFEANLVTGRLRFALAMLVASRSALASSMPCGAAKAAEAGNRSEEARERGLPSVALLRGCVMEGLFQDTNRATERVLVRNGFPLLEARGQACCGALHAHAGQRETAKRLARENIDSFLDSGCDRVIVNAAGCGAAMKEYATLLEDDLRFEERAREFSSKVRDVFEFLAEQGIAAGTGSRQRRVAYDAPCHLIHAQRIEQAPVELMKQISGITLVPLRGFESCCGGAGIYNLQHPELSAEILRDKLKAIAESGADTVASANPGCIMQIGAGLLMAGSSVDVVHPIELLDAAYVGLDH
ncbi:MAG: heterodisulfide reductase-related iron-sulfur binding cluster [Acidobacteriota bacterium]